MCPHPSGQIGLIILFIYQTMHQCILFLIYSSLYSPIFANVVKAESIEVIKKMKEILLTEKEMIFLVIVFM